MKILQNKSSKIKEKRPNLENSINFKEKLRPRKNILIDDKIKKKNQVKYYKLENNISF